MKQTQLRKSRSSINAFLFRMLIAFGMLSTFLTANSTKASGQGGAAGPNCFQGFVTKLTRFDGYADSFDARPYNVPFCDRHYFFTTYVNTEVVINYIPQVVAPCQPCDYVTLRYAIYKDGDPNPLVAVGDTDFEVGACYFEDNNYPIHFTPVVRGTYRIVFERYNFGVWTAQSVAIFTAIPMIEKV